MLIGLVGMSAASIHLWEKKPRAPHLGPFLISCAILTWLFVGWQTWLAFHHPVQGYTQAQLDAAVSAAKASVKASPATPQPALSATQNLGRTSWSARSGAWRPGFPIDGDQHLRLMTTTCSGPWRPGQQGCGRA
jgi:hypothetical protein